MIEGFFQSDTVGWLFPIRHFLEPAHNGPVPWAEEAPLYHYLVVWAMKSIAFAGITANVVILGKFLSLIAWGTLIYGFFRIGKNLNPNDGTLTPWIFALTGDRTDQSGKENPKTFTFFTGRLDFIPDPFHRKFCSP